MSTPSEKHTYEITPGSMGVVSQAVKLFGLDNVKPGGWGTPVWVQCTEEEIAIFIELVNEIADEEKDQRRQAKLLSRASYRM